MEPKSPSLRLRVQSRDRKEENMQDTNLNTHERREIEYSCFDSIFKKKKNFQLKKEKKISYSQKIRIKEFNPHILLLK